MKVYELGEFGLIELLAGIVGKDSGGRLSRDDLVVGIGDDAAAWRTEAGVLLSTTDTMVQDVDFSLSTTTWGGLGWKALAVNISDIAAMGGTPSYALLSLGLPAATEVESIAELYRGLAELARKFDVAIVGGDVSEAPLVVITLCIIGKAGAHLLTRSAALPGDQIAVSGYLGSSAAGLRMLSSGLKLNLETASFLKEAHLRPYPRIIEGQVLVATGVRAAIDVSDGLISDLAQLCKASRVEARVRTGQVPIHPLVRAAFGDDSLELALSGGEDFELLFTAKGENVDRAKGLMPGPVTVIGQISDGEPGRVTLLDGEERPVAPDKRGWEHFRAVN